MRILLAAPCNVALQDPEVGQSLIGVFHGMKIQISQDAEVPDNAMLPKEWAIFSKFGLDPDEEGKSYSLVTNIFWPDGKLLVNHLLPAAEPTKDGMNFITRMQAIPVGQEGIVKVSQTVISEGEIVCGPIELEIKVTIEKTLPPARKSE